MQPNPRGHQPQHVFQHALVQLCTNIFRDYGLGMHAVAIPLNRWTLTWSSSFTVFDKEIVL